MSRYIPMPAYPDAMPVDISFVFADECPAGKHQVSIDLLECRSGISVHQRERDYGRREYASDPCMDDLYVERFIQEHPEGSPAAEDKKQKEAGDRRRQHHRKGEYAVEHRLHPVILFYDLSCSPKTEKERYDGRHYPGLDGYPQGAPVQTFCKFDHAFQLFYSTSVSNPYF